MNNLLFKGFSKWRQIEGFWPPTEEDQLRDQTNRAGDLLLVKNTKSNEYNQLNLISDQEESSIMNNNADQTLYEDEEENNSIIGDQKSPQSKQTSLSSYENQWTLQDNIISRPQANGLETSKDSIVTSSNQKSISENNNNKQQNKSKPIQSSKKTTLTSNSNSKLTQEISSTINRITMLEEPNKRILKQQNSSSNEELNSQKILPLSELDKAKDSIDYKVNYVWPEIAANQNSKLISNGPQNNINQTKNIQQQSEQQYTNMLFLSSISAIFILLALIIHFVYYKRRVKRNGKKNTGDGGLKWLTKTFPVPSSYLRLIISRKRANTTNSLIDLDKEMAEVAFLAPSRASGSNNQQVAFNCGGERIRLMERKSFVGGIRDQSGQASDLLKRSAELSEIGGNKPNREEEIVCVLDSTSEVNNFHSTEEEKKEKASSIVILQRRLAKNSLVVAATKSTKPKVRLITARVRKFIDDEAQELGKEGGGLVPLKQRIFAYFSSRFSSPNSNSTQNCPTITGELEQEREALTSDPLGKEANLEISVEGVKVDELPLNYCDKTTNESDNILQPTQLEQLTSVALTLQTGVEQNQKLSPSPILMNAEACSSISACSLFTPSPSVESSGVAQLCDCSINGVAAQLAINQQNGLINEEVRSKSQGDHSPNQLLSHQIQAYRPCCSVSPSALDAQLVEQAAAYYNHHHSCHHHHHHHHHQQQQQQQQQQSQVGDGHKLKLISHNHLIGNDRRSTLRDRSELMFELNGPKSNNHIMRQYENYYEDNEQSDAYRRLTASIGIDFAPHSHQQINGVSTLAAYSTNPMESLLQYTTTTNHNSCPLQPQTATTSQSTYLTQHQPQLMQTINSSFAQTDNHSILLPPTRPLSCKCCQPEAAHLNPLNELRLGQPTTINLSCPPLNSFHHQFGLGQANNWISDGSTSELPSSTSTSLGGSDSGFVSQTGTTTNNQQIPVQPAAICQNPLCSCQRQVQFQPTAFNILTQQPNSTSLNTKQQENEASEKSGSETIEFCCRKRSANEIFKLIGNHRRHITQQSAQFKSNSHRAKWRQRRRQLNQKRATNSAFVSGVGSQISCSNNNNERRLSISSGQTLSSPARETNQTLGYQQTTNWSLKHRASIVSDGILGRHSTGNFDHNSSSFQNHELFCGSQSQRPSDASLFEPNFGEVLNSNKSNYSSSGGSSSGIGFSGSACTNTPTSAFAYENFLNFRQESDLTRESSHIQFGVERRRHQQQNQKHTTMTSQGQGTKSYRTNPLATLECGSRLHEQLAGSCSSRKFSLPVQLESQAAERVSPQRSRLLFEKNLQRVDSNFQSRSSGLPSESIPSGAHSQMSSSPITRANNAFDSRRSSQTITRQSSFWLEDNSADSILSLATTSGGLIEQQALGDDCAFMGNFDEISTSASESKDPILSEAERISNNNNNTSCQRPSLGSLITQSGDSIESVKQKPSSSQVEETKQVQVSIDADSSVSTNDEATKDSPACGSEPKRLSYPGESSHKTSQKQPRFSSSSTSSSTNSNSSPSPDFSKQSGRLGLAINSRSSCSITKQRNLSGKLRQRRFGARNLVSTGSLERGNSTLTNQSSGIHCKRRPLDESEEDETEEDGIQVKANSGETDNKEASTSAAGNRDQMDSEFTSTSGSTRASSDLNSASLERQCRDLWKLRATLHEDSCIADNWTNYHQRLNRRYDSGYKSIENQLSSSLEGNILAGAVAHLPAAQSGGSTSSSCTQQTGNRPDEVVRPQSVCSQNRRLLSGDEQQVQLEPNLSEGDSFDAEEQMQMSPTSDEKEKSNKSTPKQTSIESVESKLAEFDFEEEDANLIQNSSNNLDRTCNSRNSNKSSDEENKTQRMETLKSPTI